MQCHTIGDVTIKCKVTIHDTTMEYLILSYRVQETTIMYLNQEIFGGNLLLVISV